MSAQATKLSPAQLITAARTSLQAYNDKDWDTLKASVTPDFVYDEIGTGRRVQGVDAALALLKGWAVTVPDSKATVHTACASGDTVALEITWRGTHKGAMPTPKGDIPASGKPIELRSCIVCEMAGEKVRAERQYFDMGTLLRQMGAAG